MSPQRFPLRGPLEPDLPISELERKVSHSFAAWVLVHLVSWHRSPVGTITEDEDISRKLLRWSALSAGEQALRRQLQADQPDPDNRHAQSSVTRRVSTARQQWQKEEQYNDLTAAILRSLKVPFKDFFIEKHFNEASSEEPGAESEEEEVVSRSRSPRPNEREQASSTSTARFAASSSARPSTVMTTSSGGPSSSSRTSRSSGRFSGAT